MYFIYVNTLHLKTIFESNSCTVVLSCVQELLINRLRFTATASPRNTLEE